MNNSTRGTDRGIARDCLNNNQTNRDGQPDGSEKRLPETLTRRSTLGAVAALATVPAAATGARSGDRDSNSNNGADRHQTGAHGGLWASVDMGEVIDSDVEVAVVGVALDDEPGSVAVSISTTPASVSLDMSPSRARSIANDLLEAADAAESVK